MRKNELKGNKVLLYKNKNLYSIKNHSWKFQITMKTKNEIRIKTNDNISTDFDFIKMKTISCYIKTKQKNVMKKINIKRLKIKLT